MSEKLTELLKELGEATATLKDAVQSEQAARSQCCDARNRVNRVQKDIDAEMLKLKEAAEWDTNWHGMRQLRGNVVT